MAQTVLSSQGESGGFGCKDRSTLATTYYALRILTLLGEPVVRTDQVASFLREREPGIYFLEELYWLAGALQTLGAALDNADRWEAFVLGCQNNSGGFARTPIIGIATLEYTYYAISALRWLGLLPDRRGEP